MQTPRYYYGIAWIAENDEPLELDVEQIEAYISTLLLADLFAVKPAKVAKDILDYRTGHCTVRQANAYRKLGLQYKTLM